MAASLAKQIRAAVDHEGDKFSCMSVIFLSHPTADHDLSGFNEAQVRFYPISQLLPLLTLSLHFLHNHRNDFPPRCISS
jgi:hypothetical protein